MAESKGLIVVTALATVERRLGGIIYLARENKGMDSTAALLKALLVAFPNGAKVRVTVKEERDA